MITSDKVVYMESHAANTTLSLGAKCRRALPSLRQI